jgi:FKBP-type peptidyl-prolyl cis-trans isomerase
MKKTHKMAFGLMISLLWLAGTACQQGAGIPEASDMANQSDSVAYAIGMNIGNSLNTPETEDLDYLMIFRGMQDVLEENEPALSESEIQAVFTRFQATVDAKLQAENEEKGQANLAEGQEFLAENGKKEGVMTTASGLQYKVMQEGDGENPSATSQVKVHYEGKLLNGEIFDSSIQRGEPVTFPLNGVIPGWTEGLQLMKPGAKYQFYIPSELAYGLRGSPPKIGPNATLIFDVELLEVTSK